MHSSRWQRLLPPQLVTILTFAMIVMNVIDPPLPRPVSWPWALSGLLPLLGGVALTVGNARRFDREHANIVTFDDPTALIADGWFARSRNPMYVGFLLMLIGIAALLGSLAAWAGPLLFFAAANWWYIPFEERRMEEQFGWAYHAYAERVRRWV